MLPSSFQLFALYTNTHTRDFTRVSPTTLPKVIYNILLKRHIVALFTYLEIYGIQNDECVKIQSLKIMLSQISSTDIQENQQKQMGFSYQNCATC